MKHVAKYDNTKTFMYPNGELATPERVLNDYPAIEVFDHIVITDSQEQVIFSIQNIASIRDIYNIDSSLSDDEAIKKIQEILNAPDPEIKTEPTAEERIAAAMEFQNLMSL